ncbi:MAG: lysophospholipid acyltransferase family protein, partial [Spirochaetota bacterium]
MEFIYNVYRLFLYFAFFVGSVILTPVVLVISLVFGKRVANVYPHLYAKLLCLLIPIRVALEGAENIDNKKSYVVVLNHRSYMDIVVIYAALGMDIRWVMKKELTRIPFFGQSSVILGNIPIDRRNTRKAMESINRARKLIRKGTSVAFFPEGTRVNDTVLGRFKKGAFHFALDVGLPVLPVAIIGTDRIMPRGTYKFWPGRVKIIVHPPLDTARFSKKHINQFSDQVQAILYDTLTKEGGHTTENEECEGK